METTFSIQKIVLLGAGNVATQLGKALVDAGYLITQVYSQTKRSSARLAKKLNAAPITSLKNLDQTATLFIIAIKDDVIAPFAKQLKLTTQFVVHTSGTVQADVLKDCSKNFGVFYPLQTFSKDKIVDFATTPICIEANTKSATETLTYFAKSISRNVQKINSEQRKIIHLAAVFACNFSNHMYTISASILKEHHLSFDILKPLIAETADKIKINPPDKMQTGPAIRKDYKTMETHLKLLKKNKELKKIYKLVSEHINH
ncbi:MAG TPA: DUF2520 domain-containing protein [Bacteroidia bacterium]|nr:DUF2520 domain-containing protein [Bacteroidia bacterium]